MKDVVVTFSIEIDGKEEVWRQWHTYGEETYTQHLFDSMPLTVGGDLAELAKCLGFNPEP